jgi:hypothetical protein
MMICGAAAAGVIRASAASTSIPMGRGGYLLRPEGEPKEPRVKAYIVSRRPRHAWASARETSKSAWSGSLEEGDGGGDGWLGDD